MASNHKLLPISWAFAALNHEAPALFDAIATTAIRRIDKFKPQELSNTAWAFATLNHKAPELLEAIATTAIHCIDDEKHTLSLLARVSGLSSTFHS